MASGPRVSGENLYHHIYAWGNDRHPVFKARIHYSKYLELLARHSTKLSVAVIAYALMEYHVHLFLHDLHNKISEFIMRLHGDYAKYYNRINNRTGHVFGERYNNKIVQVNEYGKWLSRYIHRQAVETGMVKDPIEHEWTSYRVYIGEVECAWIKPGIILSQFGKSHDVSLDYKRFVLEEVDDPVDWDDKKLTFNADVVCKMVCDELKIDRLDLLFPRDGFYRNKRSEAVDLLLRKYNFPVSRIAAMLKIERKTLYNIIKSSK